MWLILLEAALALGILVFIVWWTMFHKPRDDIRGYDSIIPALYVDHMRDVAPQVQLDFNRIAPIYTDERFYENFPQPDYVQVLDAPLLSLLNVRYIVTYPDVLIPFNNWKAVYGDEAVVIWENPTALPRAFLLSEMPDSWLAAERPPVNEITLPTDYQAVSYSRDTGRERFLDLSLESDSWLVVSENYADGWKAFNLAGRATQCQVFRLFHLR